MDKDCIFTVLGGGLKEFDMHVIELTFLGLLCQLSLTLGNLQYLRDHGPKPLLYTATETEETCCS